MTTQLSITWPEKDKAKLGSLINDLAADAAVSVGAATRAAGGYVAKTAAFSTKKARKQRNPLVNKGQNRKFPAERYPFYIKVYKRNKPVRRTYLWQTTKATAKQDPRAQIKRRGLAQVVWGISSKKLGQSVQTESIGLARKYADVQDDSLSAVNPRVVIQSKLDFAEDAFKQRGKRTVDTISARALVFMAAGIKKGTAQKWAKRFDA